MSDFRTIATADQLPSGERLVIAIDEVYIAVFNVGGNIYAIEDACTHDDGPLAEGIMIEDTDSPKIECDRHGATFELKTGKPTFPAVMPIKRYPVRVEGGNIQIDVQSPY